MSNRVLDAAVVGAGPAGLAAAWTLAAAGVRVTLYERRPAVGGRMRTDALDGARADVAAQLLASHYEETFRLAREAGAAELLVRAPGRDALWRGGRVHPLEYGSVVSLAASSALPAGLKLRLATRYLPFLKRFAGVLDPNEPARAVEAGLDRESIAEWGRRELGEDFVELLVYPQLAAYYGCTPEETSAGFYHALARAGTDLTLYAVRGGMGELARALVRAIEGRGSRLLLGVEVKHVRSAADGVELLWDEGSARHDAVVVALPAAEARRVVAPGGMAGEWLAGVRSTTALSLALLVDGSLPVDYFGLSFPRGEPPGEHVAALCLEERKAAALGAEERSTIIVFPAPAVAPFLAAAAPEQVLDQLLPAVEAALPGVGQRVIRAKVYRFPEGGALFYPGYLEHLRRFAHTWLPPMLALAGDYLVAPTIEGAVRSGRQAAARLLAA